MMVLRAALVLALCCVALSGAQKHDDEVEARRADPSCPQVCSFIFAPVCAADYYNEFKTFDNVCLMRKNNCEKGTKFFVWRDGKCPFPDSN